MQELKHARCLRIGRYSQPGNAYLVTCAVKDRLPIFSDVPRGRMVVMEMKRLHDSGVVRSLAWVVMPDHLHWLFELKSGSLPALMQLLKGRSAFVINKAYGAKTLTWQKGYHDHGVRAEEDLIEMARYVVNNPTRAGLVMQRGDYALWDCEWQLE
ncbi:transposase [Pseudomonas sp. KU26590]|uniref:REP-associated tyrosine transposase n=1 Tax=Pseudomonas sp. KU26590 TaxID=2991051 RepID=UPI00223D0651|nr:transposase [Pseudomonas sp. KU26590]UZJ60114.1 transposase [Pseudomonas sp. KU26590]